MKLAYYTFLLVLMILQALRLAISLNLKCYYDQILDIHFFTFSNTIGVSKISCQISIYSEQQNSCFFNLSFREFTAAINFPCSKSGLRIGENDVIFSSSQPILETRYPGFQRIFFSYRYWWFAAKPGQRGALSSTRPLWRVNMHEFTHSVHSDIFYGVIYLQLDNDALMARCEKQSWQKKAHSALNYVWT